VVSLCPCCLRLDSPQLYTEVSQHRQRHARLLTSEGEEWLRGQPEHVQLLGPPLRVATDEQDCGDRDRGGGVGGELRKAAGRREAVSPCVSWKIERAALFGMYGLIAFGQTAGFDHCERRYPRGLRTTSF
jgi:hypothetical protein